MGDSTPRITALSISIAWLFLFTQAVPLDTSQRVIPRTIDQSTWPTNPNYRAPYHVPDGDKSGIEGLHIVFLHKSHTIDSHFSTIGFDLEQHCDWFSPIPSLPGYRAQCPESIFHDHVRRDPGVAHVEHEFFLSNNKRAREKRSEQEEAIARAFDPVPIYNSPLPRWAEDGFVSSYDDDADNTTDTTSSSPILERRGRHKTTTSTRVRMHQQENAPWHLVALSEPPRKPDDLPVVKRGTYHWQNGGKGVDAYIVGSGIYPENPDFRGRAMHFPPMVKDVKKNRYTRQESKYCGPRDADHERTVQDTTSRGTMAAGVVGGQFAGASKDVTLLGVKVVCDKGREQSGGLIQALTEITSTHETKVENPKVFDRYRGAVINLASTISGVLADSAVGAAISRATAAGMPVAYAISSSNERGDGFICRINGVVCVTPYDRYYRNTGFSNDGPLAAYAAPGDGIKSATSVHDLDGGAALTRIWDGSGAGYLSASLAAGVLAQVISAERWGDRRVTEVIAKFRGYAIKDRLTEDQSHIITDDDKWKHSSPRMVHNSVDSRTLRLHEISG